MAPGYVIAFGLEVAGLLGLGLGLLRLRTERQFRAAELRGLLLTGHASASASPVARLASRIPAPRIIVTVPAPAERATDAFTARTALHRALEQSPIAVRSGAASSDGLGVRDDPEPASRFSASTQGFDRRRERSAA